VTPPGIRYFLGQINQTHPPGSELEADATHIELQAGGNGEAECTVKGEAEPSPDMIDLSTIDAQSIELEPSSADCASSIDTAPGNESTRSAVYGSIDPPWEVDHWTFFANAGQYVVITMNRTWGGLDPYMELYNPYGQFSAVDDDSGGNRNARLSGTIGTSGSYTIRARSYAGRSSGGYVLSVNLGGCPPPPPPPPPPCNPPTSATVYETIDPSWDTDDWTFDAVAGQSVVITMRRTWGNLDSYMELYNPYGYLTGVDDDSAGNRDSRLAGRIATTGRYTIRARSYAGSSVGGYALTVSLGW